MVDETWLLERVAPVDRIDSEFLSRISTILFAWGP